MGKSDESEVVCINSCIEKDDWFLYKCKNMPWAFSGRPIVNGLSLFVSALQLLPWLIWSGSFTTTYLDSKSSASWRIQLTLVTNNLQLPGAGHGPVFGPVCLQQRQANDIQRQRVR